MNENPTPAGPARREPSRKRREGVWPFFLIIGLSVAIGAFVFIRDQRRAVTLVDHEDRARTAVYRVAEAQKAFHARAGRYGWIDELLGVQPLPGLQVVREEGRPHLASVGYRIDVLLPHANLGAGVVGITTEGGEHEVDPSLAKLHFAVVARPKQPGVTGFRMWYLDEKDDLFLNEGVIDDEGAAVNPLPDSMVTRSMTLSTASLLLWQRDAEVQESVKGID